MGKSKQPGPAALGSKAKAKTASRQASKIPSDEYGKYRAALHAGVFILSASDRASSVSPRQMRHLAVFLRQCAVSRGVYWRTLAKLLGVAPRQRLLRASTAAGDVADALGTGNLEPINAAVEALRNTAISGNLQKGKQAFDRGQRYIGEQLSLSETRELMKMGRGDADRDAHQIAEQATRSPITTPQYRTNKHTIARPLPGSYGQRQ